MANTDKNIVITPNNGSASDPNIVFSGANATTGAQNITLTVTPNNSGTVAFSGSAGQLLAINNDISNTLSTGGTISATGNITANNFVGNLVGNITGNFSGSLANGNSNISIPVANGNVNISAVGNANIVVVTGTGANVVGTLSVSGDANVGNIGATNGVFTNVSGNGSSLSSITGGNVTGQVGNALTAGTVYTNAQPNITSVGTLTSLSVSGNANVGNIGATNGVFTNVSGNGSTLTSITGASVTGQVGNALVAGTVYTAAQPNITSVGTLTGLTLSGNVNMGTNYITTLADPVSAQDAATKAYVDSVAQGLDPKASVVYATTTTIFGSGYTYDNGTSGVGATITSSSNGAISIDGSTPTAGDRVLIKNEAGAFVNNTTQSAAFNGIYIVTQVGSGALPFILTRATDFDNGSPSGEIPGAFTFVEAGTTNADTGWVCTTNSPVTMGTTQIVFTQFSGAGTYSAGTGLTLTGTVFSVNESQTQVTAVGTLTTLSVSGNANVGNIGAANGVFTNVSGNGSSLTDITGANVTGQVANALVSGTVYTNAQPNITSVGTLTSLSVSGNITANNFVGNLVGNVTGNFSGSLANGNSNVNIPAANGNVNISSAGNANIVVVTGTGANIAGTLSVSGNANVGNIGATNGVFTNVSGNGSSLTSITGANVTGQVANALVSGTVYTNAQPNITSVGTLTSLSTSGNITANNISIGNVETVGVFTRYSAVIFLDNANAVAGNRVVVTMPTPAAVNGMYSGVLKVYAIRQFDNPGGPRSQTTFKLSRVGNTTGANATFYVNEAVVDKTSAFVFQWYFDTTTGTPSLVIGQSSNSYNWYVESELNTSTIPTIAIGSNAGSYGTSYYPLYTLATPGTDAGGLTITASNSSNTMVFDSTGQLSLAGNITAGNLIGIFANGNSSISIPTANGNINISAAGSPNEIVITSTGINVAGTLSVSGNANVGNIGATNGVFTNVSGNGSSLTSITGANVTGQVANALVSGTVYTAAQPNITSVGTLSSLSVSGTATLAAVNGTDASFSGNATVNGNLFVNGNLTYLNVETVAVEDPIIQLQTGANGAAPIANSGKDVGTALNYYDTAAKIAFMGWDVSNAEIAFGSNVSITNEVVTFTSLANTRSGNTLTTGVFATTLSATGNANVGNIGATNGVFTNVSGNGSALTSLNASNLSSGTVSSSVLNITTSTTDTTAGKIMRTADWGFGTTAFAITDFTSNNLNYSQIFRALANATGGPGAGISGVALPYDGTPTTSYMAVTPGTTVGTVRAWAGTKTNSNGTPVWAELARLTAPTFTNYIGIGAINQNYIISVSGSQTGNTVTGGINISATVQNDVTSTAYGVLANPTTAANVFTLANFRGFQAGISLGAGSTVTNAFGFTASSLLGTNATNGYGFSSDLAAAANKWNFYAGGTANNYMAGSLGIGSTNLSAINLRLSKSITGGTTAINFLSDGTISSDVTGTAVLNRTSGITAAATFTLTNLIYNQAVQGTFGLNSTVTTQSGFTADNTLTGATNNYGFRGSIASGANRFNLYMDGTANNYSAGNFGIGTTSPAVALHVKQNAGSINVEGTDQAYIQFYPRTVANIRTAYVGIGSAGSNNFTIRNDDNGRLLLESGNSNVSVFANGNVTTTVAGVANVVVVTSTGANIAGTLSATGNITGNFFIGNGSQLTGITTATSLANGTSNVSIPAVNGNVLISSAGNANILVVTGTGANIAGTLNATGNANVGNLGAAQGIFTTSANIPLIRSGTSNITLTSGANVSTFIAGNATAQLVVTATGANIPGTANIVGLVTGGNFTTTGANGTVTANNLTLTGAASGNVNVAATLSNLGLRTVAATYTDTAVTGTQANAAIHYIAVPTVTGGSNAKTYTNMATFHIAGPVTASTNAIITTNYALFVASGNSFFGGNLSITGNITGGNLLGILANGTSNVSIPVANGNVNISVGGSANEVVVTSTGANVNGYLNITGDTTFSGVGQRILGDFSNVTLASRTAFQDKTANSVTGINILPNGTATESALTVFNNSNAANSSYGSINGNATLVRIISAATGSGTALPLTFSTGAGGTEAARIDTSQNFLIGRTSLSNNISNVKGVSIVNDGRIITEQDYNTAGIPTAGLFTQNIFNSSGNVTNMVFYRNGTSVGTIVTTASATAYNTSSDYRLKSNTQPLTGSGAFIDALKPKTWTWIINGEPGIGFIAHEVAEVAPSTVFGEKDAVNEDGTPNHQAMEYGSAEFIAHIIAELQDLRRRFAELQTEVNNLKNP